MILKHIILSGWSVNKNGFIDNWLKKKDFVKFQDSYKCHVNQYDKMEMFGRKVGLW